MNRSRPVTLLAGLALVTLLLSCATQDPGAATDAAAAKARTPVRSGTASPTTATPATDGYHHEVRNGQEYFCRRQAATGTLVEKETCLTPEELAAQRQNAEEFMRRSVSTPVGYATQPTR